MTPDRLVGRPPGQRGERRVVLQIGQGGSDTFLGAFLDAWHRWRTDSPRPARLHYIVVTAALPDTRALQQAHLATRREALAAELAAQWPPNTPNLHRLAFEAGQVQLLLAAGEVWQRLPELRAQVDVFRVGTVDLQIDPRGAAQRLCKALARLAAPEASLTIADPAWAPRLQSALISAGFVVDDAAADAAVSGRGAGGAGALHALFRPPFVPRRRQAPQARPASPQALIVGAGLAGCAAACALAEQGWHSTLIERHDAPAREGSGNPAGLFHGIVNAQDGAHARFGRAAALQATLAVRTAVEVDGARGSTQGLLRLESSGIGAHAMRARLARLGLPGDYVQALDAAQASKRCGLPLQHPAWFYPGGGWVDPAALARSFLRRAGTQARLQTSSAVHSLLRRDGLWHLLDAGGACLARGAVVVLANAEDALRLLGAAHWPVQRVRGQISLYANAAAGAGRQLRLPAVALAGAGYLLPEVDGQALFGASAQPGDDDGEARAADHAYNLMRLRSLCPQALPPGDALPPAALRARVGWRCMADDRLPLVGPAPDEAALALAPVTQAVELPRRPGLYVFSGLASRGINWAALGGQLLAAQISAAPLPLEASLVDALDPGRFALRKARRAAPGS